MRDGSSGSTAWHRDADRDRHSTELVACPLPLMPILAEDGLLDDAADAGAAARGAHPPLLQDPRPRRRARRDGRRRTSCARRATRHDDRTVARAGRAGPTTATWRRRCRAVAAAGGDGRGARHGGRSTSTSPLPAGAADRRRRAGRRARPARSAAAELPGHRCAAVVARRLAPRADGTDVLTFRRAGRDGRAAVLDGRARGGRDAPTRRVRGGRQVPRAAPDDRPPPADVAAVATSRSPACRLARRGPPVRLRRPRRTRPTSGSSPSPRSAT